MDDFSVKIPLSIPPALDAALQHTKCGRYSNVSQEEMLPELIRRGLDSVRPTPVNGASRP